MVRNLLVTCGGKWVGIVRQLQQAIREMNFFHGTRVVVADCRAVTPAGCFADHSVVVPPIDDAGYIDALVECCSREQIGILIPLIDIDLNRLAPHRARFTEVGTYICCPSPETVEVCFDKSKFEVFSQEEGIPVPRSFNKEELCSAPYPLFYKPTCGFGSQGAGICTSWTRAAEILQSAPDTIFQEIIEGKEISVDAFVTAEGRCTVRVQRVRDKVIGGEVVQSHTVRIPEICEVAEKTIDALSRRHFQGPLNVQLFSGDSPVVIEVNPRLGSGVVLSNIATHGRLLRSLIAGACGQAVGGEPEDYDVGLYLSRYLGDVIHDENGTCQFTPVNFAA